MLVFVHLTGLWAMWFSGSLNVKKRCINDIYYFLILCVVNLIQNLDIFNVYFVNINCHYKWSFISSSYIEWLETEAYIILLHDPQQLDTHLNDSIFLLM